MYGNSWNPGSESSKFALATFVLSSFLVSVRMYLASEFLLLKNTALFFNLFRLFIFQLYSWQIPKCLPFFLNVYSCTVLSSRSKFVTVEALNCFFPMFGISVEFGNFWGQV